MVVLDLSSRRNFVWCVFSS